MVYINGEDFVWGVRVLAVEFADQGSPPILFRKNVAYMLNKCQYLEVKLFPFHLHLFIAPKLFYFIYECVISLSADAFVFSNDSVSL